MNQENSQGKTILFNSVQKNDCLPASDLFHKVTQSVKFFNSTITY